ncbi:MAG: hypothetical protein O7D30_10495 [Rickettsia endosymbiont of Ixodes persulcatus]|nr:hypothetical protein [Rickettsia endosymbiont of Ixodes persulcatus]
MAGKPKFEIDCLVCLGVPVIERPVDAVGSLWEDLFLLYRFIVNDVYLSRADGQFRKLELYRPKEVRRKKRTEIKFDVSGEIFISFVTRYLHSLVELCVQGIGFHPSDVRSKQILYSRRK